MGEWLYKTWQNRSPASLINVFFCATKEDHERYFDEITDFEIHFRYRRSDIVFLYMIAF